MVHRPGPQGAASIEVHGVGLLPGNVPQGHRRLEEENHTITSANTFLHRIISSSQWPRRSCYLSHRDCQAQRGRDLPKATQLGSGSAVTSTARLLHSTSDPSLDRPGAKSTLKCWGYLIRCQQRLGEGCAPVNGEAWTCHLYPPGKGNQIRPEGGLPPVLGNVLKNKTVSPAHPVSAYYEF